MREPSSWLIRVDVGGTFTDAVGYHPEHGQREAKVLSSGVLRATVERLEGDLVVLRGEAWAGILPLLVGARVRFGADDLGVIAGADGVSARLAEVSRGVPAGSTIEIETGEPAPVVAARLVTGTPLPEPVRCAEFRFATTRATNALLERNTACAALITSRGFEDVLRIGDQRRDDLFSVSPSRGAPLTGTSFGITGRLGPDGAVVEGLDVGMANEVAKRIRESGIASVAIAMLNSWASDEQERAVESACRRAGIERVVRSSDATPRIGLLARAQAAVLEASLGPVLSSYVEEVMSSLDAGRTDAMKSDGGLTEIRTFRPIDSLLSGPAAGVIGAREVGRALGYGHVLSFDMGGTSTDVARLGGDADLAPSHTVGGVSVTRPAVDIRTVAAGGGSVCEIVDGRPTVGPRSAGAEPGPACYGAGGPLTVTDVNLLLGRIDDEAFGIPIDRGASERAFDDFCTSSGDENGPRERTLAGLLELANETMAEAIRTVSVRNGYDPAEHPLVAFGGAGPQHACDVAARLGIGTVLIPRRASLLSAVGLHEASREADAERELLVPLAGAGPLIAEALETLVRDARERLGAGVAETVHVERTARLRLAGQNATITVPFEDHASIGPAFESAYERVHGAPPNREIELVGVRVVARIVSTRREPEAWTPEVSGGQRAAVSRRVHDGRDWIEAPVCDRDAMPTGASVNGPAFIREHRTQTWVPPGWSATIERDGTIRATHEGGARADTETSESLARELVMHRITSIAEQMGEALERAAVSVNVKDRRDYSCGVLDREGRLVTSAAHLPVHLGALGPCVRAVVEALPDLGPGDAALTNHPAYGGSHLPDLTVVQPVFDVRGGRLGYVASRAHHAEVGGLTPGSMPPDATSLADEGVVIAPTLIAKDGRFLDEEARALFASGAHPSRNAEDNMSDLRAAVVAGERAIGLLRMASEEFGRERVLDAMGWIIDHTARLTRARLEAIEGLPASVVETMDGGCEIRVRVDRSPEGLLIDFGGTSPTHPGNINAPLAVTRSAVAYVARLLLDRDVPLNDGFLDAIRVRVPEGCFLNPVFDADPSRCPPVAGGNVETSQRVTEALLRALRLCAGGPGTMNNLLLGNERFGLYETVCSGAPATETRDGADAIHQHMTNTRITDAEVLEQRFPIRVERFEIRRGSCGAGRHVGGDGVVREIRALEVMTVTVLTQRREEGSPGMDGGDDGAPGSQRVVRADGSEQTLNWADRADLLAGDRIVIETPGGGGWGHPDQPPPSPKTSP